MMAWLQQVVQEFFSLADAYPSITLFVIILIIALALLWVWFKVPATNTKHETDKWWVKPLAWVKTSLSSFIEVLRYLVEHLFINSGDAYKTPLYLQFKPQNDKSPLNTVPARLARRNAPDYLREMLSEATEDNWYLLKDMSLVELPIALDDEASDVSKPSSQATFRLLQKTLKQISSKRPQRPLDGIVISISARFLTHVDSPKLEELVERMVLGLSAIDAEVPFALPTYFIVSHCESLIGFEAFAQQNWEQQDQIFGCSSDLEFGEKYQRGAIRRAFNSIHEEITRNQVEQSAKPAALVQGDQYVLLDREVSKLAAATEVVCEKLFDDSSHKNGFYFRGIYFVGSRDDDETQDRHSGELFLSELLQKKISAEANLAIPTDRGLLGHKHLLDRYKQISTLVIMLLFVLGAYNLWGLKTQIDSVKATLLQFESTGQSNSRGYAQVYQVLDQLSQIDAREFKRIGLPASWFAGVDDKLVQLISDYHLEDIVFPAMECTLGTQFATLLRSSPPHLSDKRSSRANNNHEFQQVFADAWISELEQFLAKRHAFIDLSKPSVTGDKDVLRRFSDLIYALYGAKPDNGFFRRSDLYQLAMEKLDYPYQSGNRNCPDGSTGVDQSSSQLFWEFVYTNAQQFYAEIQKSSLSPTGPIDHIDVAGSGRAVNITQAALMGSKTDGQELVHLSRWFDYLERSWLGEKKNSNPCRQMYRRLSSLQVKWEKDTQVSHNVAARSVALFSKANCEDVFYKQLLRNSYDIVAHPFTLDAAGAVQFSPSLMAFRGNYTSLQDLSFMSLDMSDIPSNAPNIVMWDQVRLVNALSYYREYEQYAKINFDKLTLPAVKSVDSGEYALQGVMIDQLRNAMVYEIEWAKQGGRQSDNKTASIVTGPEQQVLDRVENFRSVDQLFYQVRDVFAQLGFIADSETWVESTRASALSILRQVDQLATDSRLYLSEVPVDTQSTHILKALYGINDAADLQTYLAAQNERASFIAYNYADTPVTYLLNSGIELITTPNVLEQRWQETLVELDKNARKNPNSSMTALESRFKSSLGLTVSTCETDYVIQPGSDIFTQAETTLASSIMVFCGRMKATSVTDHYRELAKQFNTTLKGRYPFVDVRSSNALHADDASLAAVRAFFQQFDSVSADLLSEFSAKSKSSQQDSTHQTALEFLRQLESVSKFLASSLNQSNGVNAGKMKAKIAFKVYRTPPFGDDQVLSRSMDSNGQSASRPGAKAEIEWRHGASVYFNARLASSSPYEISGTSGNRVTLSSRSARFNESGTWALLRMLERYRVAPPLRPLAEDTGPIILEFPLPVRRSKTSVYNFGITAPPQIPSVFKIPLGVELFGFNHETQQSEPLKLPDSFPYVAPTL